MESITCDKKLLNKVKCNQPNTITINGKRISEVLIVCDEKGSCFINDSLAHTNRNLVLVELEKCHTDNNPQKLAEENIKQKILRDMLQNASTCANAELYASARKDYERALNFIAEHPYFDEFPLTENEYVSIMYACAQCNVYLETFEGISKSIDLYNNLLQKWKNKFPCLYFSKAYALYKLDYIEKALSVVEEGLRHVDNCTEMCTLYWPTTNKAILNSEPDELRLKLIALRKSCLCPRQHDAICAYCSCEEPSNYIYFDGLTFSGCTVLICSRKCKFTFHPKCWKKYVKDEGMYPKKCFTSKCDGFIKSANFFDKDQREKMHIEFQDPIPNEQEDIHTTTISTSDAGIYPPKSDSQSPPLFVERDKNETQSFTSDVEVTSKRESQNPSVYVQEVHVTKSFKSDVEITTPSKSPSQTPVGQEQEVKTETYNSDVEINTPSKPASQTLPWQEQIVTAETETVSCKSDFEITPTSKPALQTPMRQEHKDKNDIYSFKSDLQISSPSTSASQTLLCQEQKDKNMTQSYNDVKISNSSKRDSTSSLWQNEKHMNQTDLTESDVKISRSPTCDPPKMLSKHSRKEATMEYLNYPFIEKKDAETQVDKSSAQLVDVGTQENLIKEDETNAELRAENIRLRQALRESDYEYNTLVIAYKKKQETKCVPKKDLVDNGTQTKDDIKIEIQNLKYQLQYANQDIEKLVQENRTLKYNLQKSRNEAFVLQSASDKKLAHFTQELRDLSNLLVSTKREKESLEQTKQRLINLLSQQMKSTSQIVSSYFSSYKSQCSFAIWELRNINQWLTNESIPNQDDVNEELKFWTNKLSMVSSNSYAAVKFYNENIKKVEAGDLNNIELNCSVAIVPEDGPNLFTKTYRVLIARNRQLELEVSQHIFTLYNHFNNLERNSMYSMELKENEYKGDEKKLKAIHPNPESNIYTQISTEHARTTVSDDHIMHLHTENNEDEKIIEYNEPVMTATTTTKTPSTATKTKVSKPSDTNAEKNGDIVGQDALVQKLGEVLPLISESEIKAALDELRSSHGSLSGWPSPDIIEAVRHIFLKKKKSKEIASLKQMKIVHREPCSICKEKIKHDEGTKLRCDHIFHTKCIKIWLRNHDMCPVCKEVAFFEKRKC